MGMYGCDNLDSAHSIDLTSLRKWGALIQGWRSGAIRWTGRYGEERGKVCYDTKIAYEGQPNILRLRYTSTSRHGESHEMDYQVPLLSIPCRYGGRKWFFQCPNASCNRRCRIMYESGSYFVCRKCTGLWYDSQTYITNLYRPMQNLFDADKLEQTLKRHYYRGLPTRKYRRYLKLTRGMDWRQRAEAERAFIRGIEIEDIRAYTSKAGA